MSSFPSMIANEPPPLDSASEEEDSEDFQTPRLKLDVVSAEPSPLSTPLKKASQFLQRPDNSTLPAALSPTVSETNSLPNGYGDHDDDADGSSSIDSRSIPNDSPVKATQVEDRLSSPASKNPVDEEAENISGNSSPSKSSQEYSDCLNQSSEADKSPDIRSLQAPSEVESNFGSAEGDIIGENQIINVRNSSLSVSVSYDQKGEELIGGSSSSNNNRIEQEEVDPVDRIRDMPDGDGKERAVTVEENGPKELSPSKIDGSYSDVADRLTEFQDTYDDFQQSSDEQTKGTKPHNFENQDSLLKDVEDDAENFGDFEAFQSSTFDEPPSSLQSDIPGEGSGEMKTSYIGEVDEEDDGFGDFSSIPPVASSSAPSLPQPQEQTSSIQPSAQIEDDDDFSDFQDFQEPPTPLHVEPSTSSSSSAAFNQFVLSPRTSLDFSAALESKFENLIKTVIPKSENAAPLETHTEQEESKSHTDFKSIDNEMSKSSDSYWSHVQDFEESKGLLHKWLNSLSQQKMYKSLRIDTSNIVYTEKWGAIEVPRFAASMVETPILQPQVYSSSSQSNYTALNSNNVPASDDTSSSGSKKPISKEARQILQQLPDISFMTAKTLVFPQTGRPSSNSLL